MLAKGVSYGSEVSVWGSFYFGLHSLVKIFYSKAVFLKFFPFSVKKYCILPIQKNGINDLILQSRETNLEHKRVDSKVEKGCGMNWEIGLAYMYTTKYKMDWNG